MVLVLDIYIDGVILGETLKRNFEVVVELEVTVVPLPPPFPPLGVL